ncbi:hypothetical protein [Mycolicibacterium psychrotolerans]|uniref:hypothetical protein n=1 Tax=Mycolicibacterium psychrotolerans TaxID=216929 RepID=UPI0013D53B10|nr:hypothetical protein [Mycolicibacterium psychrotolerans]
MLFLYAAPRLKHAMLKDRDIIALLAGTSNTPPATTVLNCSRVESDERIQQPETPSGGAAHLR